MAMIYRVGIDLVEIERIKKAVFCFEERFLDRVFTEEEVAYCRAKANKDQSLAARFCAKEAVIKALRLPALSLCDYFYSLCNLCDKSKSIIRIAEFYLILNVSPQLIDTP